LVVAVSGRSKELRELAQGRNPSVLTEIEGLRDRVEARGGTLEVESPPGSGTLVTAWIPERRFRG
jgi:signal transduction histidine kinase